MALQSQKKRLISLLVAWAFVISGLCTDDIATDPLSSGFGEEPAIEAAASAHV